MKCFCAPRALQASAFAIAALALSAPAYVGQWHSYTDKSRITSLTAHDGHVYAGTQGGIRRIDPGSLEEREFDNLDGLRGVWITGMARDGAGTLWAVSRDGYVHALSRDGNRWDTRSRSYAALQWTMNDRAVLAAGGHLYLGSSKGLAVFDTEQNVSQLTLTRFGDALDVSVLSLLRREDTLYAGTEIGVFKAPVDFANPLDPAEGYANPADHNQWIPVELDTAGGLEFNHLAFEGDSLRAYGPGTLLASPPVEAFDGSPLVVNGATYPADWDHFTSAVAAGERIFAGGRNGLAVVRDPIAAPLGGEIRPAPRAFPRDTIANIGASGGSVWGHSPSGLWEFNSGSDGFHFRSSPVTSPSPELYTRFLRNLVVTENADVFIASWGGGLVRVRGDQGDAWTTTTNPCIFQGVTEGNTSWTVVHSLSRPRDGSLYFTVFKGGGEPTHQLVHFDTDTDQIQCLEESVAGEIPHAVHAFEDTLLGIATNEGLMLFDTRRISTGIEETFLGIWTIPGSANEAWDLATDDWDRHWALFGSGLAYLDSLNTSTTQQLGFIDNFTGENCRSLESDPAGLLWVGCDNGLFHVRTGPAGELESVRRYTPDDGLLSRFIYDVSVDPADGRVWVATDRGVSMFESPSQPEIPRGRLSGIVPYPNPFRPHHRFVILDNLPSNSTVRIHAPSGNVVRIFHPRDLQGNQIQWDGKNESGRPVSPGVYLYSIVSGSSVERGKIIVAR